MNVQCIDAGLESIYSILAMCFTMPASLVISLATIVVT
jgi:hypothetical protein